MQQYQLIQSSTLNLFIIVMYILVVSAIFMFFDGMLFISHSLALLTLLLLYRDQSIHRQLKSQDPTIITLHNSKTSLELHHLGNHFQFEKIRLFSNRWFLILQLRNEHLSKNVMLVPDRFKKINDYLRFRYQIINMVKNHHAT